MKNICIGVVLCILCVCATGFADVVYLQNGTIVQGDIVERSDTHIKINTLGVMLTYYFDEIDRIEEGDAPSAPISERAPAPPASVPQRPAIEIYTPDTPFPEGRFTGEPAARESAVSAVSVDSQLLSMGKKDLIMAYIETSGTRNMMSDTFAQIIAQAAPEESAMLRELLNVDEIVTELVPVYDKHFDENELRALITFYRSPIGRKLLKVTPLIMQESMEASSRYFQQKTGM